MRENLMKKALRKGQVVIGGGVSQLKGAAVPQLYAAAGFQFIWIDMQHSAYSIENVFELVIGARAAGIENIVRIPSIDPPLIARLMDSGVQGIMIPEIKEVKEVMEVIKAVKYPPEGERSLVGKRIHTDFIKLNAKEMAKRVNEETLVVIQIETEGAFDHLAEIANVPGVDVLWVGPNDLANSLGHLGDTEHPEVLGAIETIIDISLRAKVAPALTIPFNFRNAERWIKKGAKVIAYSNDIDLIVEGASQGVKKIMDLMRDMKN
jgi:4-hydroxy-2-oxoheptanedioate aldolase